MYQVVIILDTAVLYSTAKLSNLVTTPIIN